MLIKLSKGTVPSKVRLFKAGANKTAKGTFNYNPSLIKELKQNQAQDGRDRLPIDVAHLSLSDSQLPDSHISIGWFELEYKSDGIWASNIKWTEKGRSYIENKEFRFISPAFRANKKNEIVYIDNFAVTNEPATYSPIPLTTASKQNNKEIKTMSEITEDKTSEADKQIVELAAETVVEVPAEEESEESEDTQLEEVEPEAKDKMIEDLTAQVATLQAQLQESNAKLAEYEMAQTEAEKEASLSEVALSDGKKEFLKKLSLDQIKEYVKLSKESADNKKVIVEDKKEESVKVVELKDHQKTQVLSKSTISPNQLSNIPSEAQIKEMAQRIAAQRQPFRNKQ